MKLFLISTLITIIKAAKPTPGSQTPDVVVSSQEKSSTVTTTQTVTSGSMSGPAAQSSDLSTQSTTVLSGSPQVVLSTSQAHTQQDVPARQNQAPRAVDSSQEGGINVLKTQPVTRSTTSGLATRSTDNVSARNIQMNENPTLSTKTVQSNQQPLVSVDQGQKTAVTPSLNTQRTGEAQHLPIQASVAGTPQGTARSRENLTTAQPPALDQIKANQTSKQTREGSLTPITLSTSKPSDRQNESRNLSDTPQHDQPHSAQKHRPTIDPSAVGPQHPITSNQSSSQRTATQESVKQKEKQPPVLSQKVTKAVKPPKSKKTKSHEEKAKKSKSKRSTKSKSDKENVENDEKKKSKSKSSDKKKKSGKSKKSKSKGTEKKPKSVKPKKSAT
ncbi:hypothetical protein NBO_2g0076 [Nosema bombycis CQ1]|uniref:Uncharacterized protein n=1 Tax=Nosema bombycis (strain CQ1 / CVCC 102059) TaxID=578461 RepID=R0MMW9_NOSB1|nr:hypothetical protein NBO_2g0076 [Nosema bombycis CQ1]|eukprot:EOB15585.1 hypothetical protein NBO_2g0076 [Nosema bombycis CQ1]